MKKNIIFAIYIFFCLFLSCDKEKEFQYELELLTGTIWTDPYIEEQNLDHAPSLVSPVIFHENGTVIMGDSYQDQWYTYGEYSVVIVNKKERWQIMGLSADTLRLERHKHPEGNFIVRLRYHALEE